MAGRGKHVEVIDRALCVRLALYGGEERVVNTFHNGVGPVIIVAEEGSLVLELVPQEVFSFEVEGQGFEQPIHAYRLFIEHVGLDGGKTVRDRANAAALNVVGVITRSTIVVVLPIGYTVVDHHRKKGR